MKILLKIKFKLSGDRLASVSAGDIVIAMLTIPTFAKKGRVDKNYWKIPHGSRPMILMD